MATISRIQGTSGSQLTGQVAESTGPSPDNERGNDQPPVNSDISKKALPQDQSSVELDSDKLQEMVDQIQKTIDRVAAEGHEVGFREDKQTESTVIEIRNPDGTLLKQFPPEKVLNLMRKLDELSGMVVDEMT